MANKIDLKALAVKHSYYCSDSNYYSNEASESFVTWADFFEEFGDADIDMNLCFRWDVQKYDESDNYYMELFFILQRKGIYKPIHISRVFEQDVESIVMFLQKHLDYLNELWKPLEFKALENKT